MPTASISDARMALSGFEVANGVSHEALIAASCALSGCRV